MKIGVFRQISRFILKTTQDPANMSNGVNFNDLE